METVRTRLLDGLVLKASITEYDDAWALRDYLDGFDEDELPFGVLA